MDPPVTLSVSITSWCYVSSLKPHRLWVMNSLWTYHWIGCPWSAFIEEWTMRTSVPSSILTIGMHCPTHRQPWLIADLGLQITGSTAHQWPHEAWALWLCWQLTTFLVTQADSLVKWHCPQSVWLHSCLQAADWCWQRGLHINIQLTIII